LRIKYPPFYPFLREKSLTKCPGVKNFTPPIPFCLNFFFWFFTPPLVNFRSKKKEAAQDSSEPQTASLFKVSC